jgi:3-dehydroquinate synthase
MSERYGAVVLVVCRALPVFAEASVLLMGVNRLGWRPFLAAVLPANFGIALAYAAFGEYAAQRQWLASALAISIAAPVVGGWLVRKRLFFDDPRTETGRDSPPWRNGV